MNKNQVILQNVVFNYHPIFTKKKQLRNIALKYPQYFNVELLVEECFANVGSYKLNQTSHYDFSDYSDSKTSSISSNPLKTSKFQYRGEIRNVSTLSGHDKVGDLRCIVYNPHTLDLFYIFLPKPVWSSMVTRSKKKTAGIAYTYNSVYNDIPKFIGYECETFEELALLS